MKHTHRTYGVATLALFALLTAGVVLNGSLTAAAECVGKPYGTAGCPLRPAASSSSQSSTAGGMCGNAIKDSGEQCDQGRFNGKGDCSTECKNLYCGDGVLTSDIGEECEPKTEEVYVLDKNGNLTTEVRFTGNDQCGWMCKPPTCDDDGVCRGGCQQTFLGHCAASGSLVSSSSTSSAAVSDGSASSASSGGTSACGNGTVDKGEACDDGNKENADYCTNECRRTSCGDGIVQIGAQEECDDGNTASNDTCTNDCKLPRCGDGIVQPTEQCDDGSRNSDAVSNACRTNCMKSRCGDGIVDDAEQCDAGAKNSDLAPNLCRTTCRLPRCGDGIVDDSEECDDGNRQDFDQCTNSCKKPMCGDGLVQKGEECDWGDQNANDPDACRRTCRLPKCGDRIVDTGEQCDGSNGCDNACKKSPASVTGATTGKSSSEGKTPTPVLGLEPPAPPAAWDMQFVVGIVAAIGGVALTVTGFVLRKRLTGLVRLKNMKSLDDIPLDQIEMPWHKW